jgi:DNA-binding transcriptional LysR family regulator
LTQAGAVFKRHVDAMLHQLDDGIAAVSQLIEPDTGTVALAFQQSLGTWLVPDLVRSFRAAHPSVTFQLTQVRDEVHSAALDGGLADLEIGTRRARSASLRTRLIAIEPLRLAVQRDHPRAGQRLHLAEVSGEPFVSLRPTSALRKLGDDLCQQAGFRPAVVFEGDDLSTVRGFVLDAGAVRDLTLTWSAERRLLPAAELFRRHVIRSASAGQVPALSA